MATLEEFKEKRKKSLIVVCTLGLSTLFVPKWHPVWMTNIFEGVSFAKGEMSWFFKLLSFTFFGLLVVTISFIVEFVKLIYYSIVISKYS